jgi:iron complex outermembrane receptor protein
MLYASVNRGAKGGGWSAPVSGAVDPTALPYKQETLASCELGEKLTFWDGRARLNSALFYYDYRNYQGFFLQGLTNVVRNVDANVKGGSWSSHGRRFTAQLCSWASRTWRPWQRTFRFLPAD